MLETPLTGRVMEHAAEYEVGRVTGEAWTTVNGEQCCPAGPNRLRRRTQKKAWKNPYAREIFFCKTNVQEIARQEVIKRLKYTDPAAIEAVAKLYPVPPGCSGDTLKRPLCASGIHCTSLGSRERVRTRSTACIWMMRSSWMPPGLKRAG
uniref:(northern house mosquito) hypothetical protein n=1 Tax=Culex pipiens TaxID=7175 RepID=A0A8D8A0R6_CULPI